MKRLIDFSSRFRILKGGKVSLVVSALALGSIINVAQAEDIGTSSSTVTKTSDNTHSSYTVTGVITTDTPTALEIINTNGGSSDLTIDMHLFDNAANQVSVLQFIVDPTTTDANSITNNAMINGKSTDLSSAKAIEIGSSAEIDDMTITNNSFGNISAISTIDSAYGIYLAGSNADNLNISNLGSISAESQTTANGRYFASGIHLDRISTIINSSISSSGILRATGPEAAGIYVYGNIGPSLSITDTAISNGGIMYVKPKDITDNESEYAKGIFVYAVEQNMALDRFTITNDENGEITVESGKTGSGIEVYAEGDLSITNSKIENHGVIDVSTVENGAYGINVHSDGTTTVTDTFRIDNFGTISVETDTDNFGYGRGIYMDTAIKTVIKNATDSTIDVSGYGAYGIYTDTLGLNGFILNYGDINIQSVVANNSGITVEDMVDGATIENHGNIVVNADTQMAGGIAVGGDSGFITNDGTVTATLDQELDKSAYSINSTAGISVYNGFTAKADAVLSGNIKVLGELTNEGVISLPSNANLAYLTSLYPTLDSSIIETKLPTITTFTNKSTGILEIGLQTDGTTTSYSQLRTTDATFEDGSTIRVKPTASTTQENANLLINTTLEDVVSASNSLTIEGTLNIASTALLDFERVITQGDDTTIDLKVTQAKSISDSVDDANTDTVTSKTASRYSNAKGAAKALDTIVAANNSPAMNTVINQMLLLPTDEAVAQAVESTTPQTTGATVGAAGQISTGISGIVEQRQNITMGGGLNSGDEMFTEKNAWIKPFGSLGSQNDKDGINGFDLKAYGIGMGIDGEYKPNQTLGFAFFYTSANVEVNNVAQKSDLDVFTTLVYGNVPVIDEKTKLLYQLGYAWQKTSGERILFTGETATSDYTSKTASLDLKLVRDYKINDELLLQPMVTTTYRHFTNPAYSETGAGALNLDTQKFTSTELILGLGTMAYYKLDTDSKIIGNVNVGYDIHDRQQSVTASYQGASGVSFDTDGIDNGKWSYEMGVGYEKELGENSNINISYNYQGQGSDFSNNTISAKYVLKF